MNQKHLESLRNFWTADRLDEAGILVASKPNKDCPKGASAGTSVVDTILAGIPYDSCWRVLEIGCGFGRVIKPMRQVFAVVDGVDISETILERAREYMRSRHNTGNVWLNNGYDLRPATDNTYDLVYSVLVFQHIRSASIIRNYLKETVRVLKPNGYFRLQVHKWVETFGKSDNESEGATWSGNAYTESELSSMVTDANMTVLKVETIGPHIWLTAQK